MKTLRLFILVFCSLLFGLTSKAQWVSIPDTNFANFLDNNGFSMCLQGNNSIGWQMDTTCPLVISCSAIGCDNKAISDLTGIQYFDGLTSLDCPNNNLASLPPLPPLLKYLTCNDQVPGLSALPDLPPTLLGLLCSGNALTFLPALPDSLADLIISHNQITSLPVLPSTLYSLNCSNNSLTEIPALPTVMHMLNCSYNPLSVPLPALPANLVELNCEATQQSSIPALPATLTNLYMGLNPLITTLPVLPPGLKDLSINYTSITNLGTLPPSLSWLNCNHTNIATLPTLPDTLLSLWADFTNITSVPPVGAQFNFLSLADCYSLTSLPALPDSLVYLNVSGDSNLTCMPRLGAVRSFYFAGSGIKCFPNYPRSVVQAPLSPSSLPLCDVFNTNGCSIAYNIGGLVYQDANSNCVPNAGEPEVMQVPVQLWSGGTLQKLFSNTAAGGYSFKTTYGTYQITIDTVNTPYRIKCPSTGSLTSVVSALDSIDNNMNFAVECKTGFDLQAQSVSTNQIFRPANFTTVEVTAGDASNFYNAHCAAGVSGAVTLSFTGPVRFIAPAGGALTPTVTGNTLTYSIANFGTVNFFEDFDVVMQTDTFAQANQQVCFTLNVTPTSGDNNPANNTFSICYTVVNSYDPNDKQVSPSGNIDTTQRDLVYTIRFQNTGNADAQHIYITDTLSSSINPASFQLLAYSHAPMVQLDGNRLRFNFPNINLPDSTTNEPASHGYVQFKVKLNNGLPVGTVINNTAFIYFDFNAPVVTNTTTNTIYVPAPPAIKPVSIGKYRIDRGVKPNGRL